MCYVPCSLRSLLMVDSTAVGGAGVRCVCAIVAARLCLRRLIGSVSEILLRKTIAADI